MHIQADNRKRAIQCFDAAFEWSGITDITKGTLFKREKFESTWGPWEYINPPMAVGVEYRTTERYQGKPVYVKAVDCGAMANNKVVTIVDDSKRLLDVIVKGNPTLFPMVPVNTVFTEWDGGFSCGGAYAHT